MKTITYPNGVQLSYDDTITVGQLITTYHVGYHVLTRIEYGDQVEMVPMFHYVKVLNADGTPSERLESISDPGSCNASYCKKVTLEGAKQLRDEAVQRANQCFDAMSKFL